MSEKHNNQDTCNCCPEEPERPSQYNLPGRNSLEYRIGVHGEFLARMIANLTRAQIPDGENAGQKPLLNLTTRQKDDPAIALLDSWAILADILSFYQERIANEGFLRTATERRSLLELGRAIGYELRPGVAASTYLSFNIESASGSPKSALIPKGTAVQSIPAKQGETPQTFETSDDFTGYPEWNKLYPQLTQVQEISAIDTVPQLYIAGTDHNLQVGDMILLIDNSSGSVDTAARRITKCQVEYSDSHTIIDLEGGTGSMATGGYEMYAPPAQVMLNEIDFTGEKALQQVYQNQLSEMGLQAMLGMYGWNMYDLLNNQYTPVPPPEGISVHVFRESCACFGHNAPRWETLPVPNETRGGTGKDPYSQSWDEFPPTIWQDSQSQALTGADLYLERAIKGINPDSYIVFTSPGLTKRVAYQVKQATDTSRVDYALSGKATALELTNIGGGSLVEDDDFYVRTTTAYVKSEQLTLAELPIDAPVPKDTTLLTLDSMVIGLSANQPVALSGEQADASGVTRSEVHLLKNITHANKRTTLEFQSKLAYSYTRKTLTLNANVVQATHGETVPKEVLGSGNGSATNQRFKLKKKPLTYTSASTASGIESSLRVRVDGVEWEESPSLYPLTPGDRKYVVRRDNDGVSTVIFGDGAHGARLPSGQENIIAAYRNGIGVQAEVETGSLTLLKTRPLGVKDVKNPVAASGAGDPETLEKARINAPLTVKTLERIVSLTDFTDFTRSFAGIGKAQAMPIWNGEQQIVHITIASESGEKVTEPLLGNLRTAINQGRDPWQKIELASFQRRYFHVTANLLIDEAYLWVEIETAVRQAIQAAFAFEARNFAQPVTSAELIHLIHAQKGVLAVDIDELYLVDDSGNPVGDTLLTVLSAETARWNTAQTMILPAELLIVNPGGIKLTKRASG